MDCLDIQFIKIGTIVVLQLNKIFPISNSGGKWNVPFVRRFPYILLSISVIFTLGTASVLSVVGVTLYRLTMSTILSGLDTSDLITDNAVLIASATSVLINFACVQILNELFGRCAKTRDPQNQTCWSSDQAYPGRTECAPS